MMLKMGESRRVHFDQNEDHDGAARQNLGPSEVDPSLREAFPGDLSMAEPELAPNSNQTLGNTLKHESAEISMMRVSERPRDRKFEIV